MSAAYTVGMSAHAMAEQRFTAEGAKAPSNATNPYRPGCAAATWWQRGHDAANTKGGAA